MTDTLRKRYGQNVATYIEYMRAAFNHAEFEQNEDGTWYGHIPGLDGLWADGSDKTSAQMQLWDALDGWLYVNFWISKMALPKFDDVDIAEPPHKVE